jgi:zinc protease
MTRALNQTEAAFYRNMERVGGFGGKADQLNAYSVFVNDPGYFERDMARYAAITQQDLHRAVRKYLRTDNRVLLSVVPKGKLSLALPDSTPAVVS